jgi:hypothetical protein
MTVQSLLNNLYGYKTRSVINRETAAIGVAAVRILKTDNTRASVLIVNNSANTIYVLNSPNVSSSRGIVIPPSGSLLLQWFEDGMLGVDEWYGISSGAASSVTILENLMI